jgi:hypothetical protein
MEQLIESIIETEWGLDIKFKSDCIIDNNNALEIVKYICERCNKIKMKKVVINAPGLTRHVSVMKLMDMAELYQKLCPGIKIAFVATHLVNNEDSRTLETFSLNRGVFIKYFGDRDTGLEWLNIKDPSALR